MVSSNREACITECLKWEGGYSNDAADPGGPTNWGITIIDARKYWKKDATAADVKAMPKSVAINIYTTKYWKTPFYDCDKLNAGVDLSVFDFGVNSGPSRAKKYLDQSVGGTDMATITKLNDSRLAFLKSLKTWPTFGHGWGTRVAGIKAKSLQMSKSPSHVGPVAGGVIAGGAVASTHIHNWLHVAEIASATILGALAIYLIIKWLKNRKVTNVSVVK